MTGNNADKHRTARSPSRGAAVSGAAGFARIVPALFMLSLVVPTVIPVGSLVLFPHRLLIIIAFFPLLFSLLTGRAGKLSLIDFAVFFSTTWAVLAIAVNPGIGKIEPMGVYVVEFFGAYLVGRVGIRSAGDYYRFVRIYFVILLVLLPFVIAESVLGRPVLLDLIPNSIASANSEPRWGLRRAQGPFTHSIIFGIFASSAFGLFWYVLRPAWLRVTGVGITVISTFFSLSTGPLLNLVMQSIFVAWEALTNPRRWRWRLFALLVVLAYFTVDLLSNRSPFHVLVTYATFNTGSAYMRILIWQFGVENVQANPWFGLGLDIANWSRPDWMLSSVDNFWLLTAMMYGIPSVLALASAIVMILRRVSRATLSDDLTRRLRAGFLTGLGGIVVAGATVHYWHAMQAFVMFFIGAGVWFIDASEKGGADASTQNAEPEEPEKGIRYTRFARRHPDQSDAGHPGRD